ncbi:MAG: sigma-70 family RNA polymerase sigma factor [Chloroflexota bacterium]
MIQTDDGHQPDDGDLIRRTRAGDTSAFDVLVGRHTPRLYRMVRRLVSDGGEAEAVVQEAWLRAWRALPNYDETRPTIPWLARIALNVARDRARRERFEFSSAEPDGIELQDQGHGPEEWLERTQSLERLAMAVQQLPAAQRVVVALRYDGDLSYEEIAHVLGIPLNTVRTHLHRAKAALRRRLEGEGE